MKFQPFYYYLHWNELNVTSYIRNDKFRMSHNIWGQLFVKFRWLEYSFVWLCCGLHRIGQAQIRHVDWLHIKRFKRPLYTYYFIAYQTIHKRLLSILLTLDFLLWFQQCDLNLQNLYEKIKSKNLAIKISWLNIVLYYCRG